VKKQNEEDMDSLTIEDVDGEGGLGH